MHGSFTDADAAIGRRLRGRRSAAVRPLCRGRLTDAGSRVGTATFLFCIAAIIALTLTWGLHPPTVFAAATIPDDVTEFFRTRIPGFVTDNELNSQDEDALRAIRDDPTPDIGDVQITYLVDPDDDGALTVTESDGWSAVVRHAGEPTGVATVSRNASNGELEPGWSDDTTLARYLIRAERDGRALVGDAAQQDNTASGPSWRVILLVTIGTLIVVGSAAGFIITRRRAADSS